MSDLLPKNFKPVFEQEYSVYVPEHQRSYMFRWQNKQWVGKELIPLSENVPQELKEAAYTLCSCGRMRMKFRLKKDGTKIPLSLLYMGKKYILTLK